MAQLIVRNAEGSLEIATDSTPGVFELDVIYRSNATKTLSIKDGNFVESDNTGRNSRVLFPTNR